MGRKKDAQLVQIEERLKLQSDFNNKTTETLQGFIDAYKGDMCRIRDLFNQLIEGR